MASKPETTNGQKRPAPEGHERFNLATMSGVFPGTRTPLYQRVQVEQQGERYWLQVLWYENPLRIVAYHLTPAADTPDREPLFTVPVDAATALPQLLQTTLHNEGLTLRSCGSCARWQRMSGVTPDQLPLGRCRWQPGDTEEEIAEEARIPLLISSQSPLAPPCRHWQLAPSTQSVGAASTAERATTADPVAPLRRAAEDAEIRQPFGQRLRRRLGRWLARQRNSGQQTPPSPTHWQAELVERSGVGAGTEPCLVCHGRIANLGALTVATEEDDKQTFSIWRCRSCYALYLNNWVDRWERLDSLETEESYYRLAPQEASELLTLIHTYEGGEHPNRRHERTAARASFLAFLDNRTPLSHQIRQGR
ncbi:MAG: hypothetical protein KDE58_16715 [Caldilineaceae bacterium]|nr:hypothetical protein [Caldilineaceae bacterium]